MEITIGEMRKMRKLSLDDLMDNVVGRSLIVILKTTLFGTTSILLFPLELSIPPVHLKFGIAGTVGLVAGLTSRHLLKGRTRLLRLMAAFTAVLVGLAVTELFSFGFVGIRLFFRTSLLPDWDGLVQAGLGAFVAWLAVSVWQPKPADARSDWDGSTPLSVPKSIVNHQTPIQVSSPGRSRFIPLVRGWPGRRQKISVQSRTAQVSGEANSRRWLGISLPSPSVGTGNRKGLIKPLRRPKQTFKKKRQNGHFEQVKLVGAEEHSCPFCLELVIFDDPRGVEICPVCHTYHHADCWEITGTCQVPHFQG